MNANPLAEVNTLAELLTWRGSNTPAGTAYRQCDPATGRWLTFTWREVAERVTRYAAALTSTGLVRGGRVAILLPNGVDAVCIDQAALAIACVPVPMHAIDNPESIAYILNDSEAMLLMVQTERQWQAIAASGVELPALRQVVIIERPVAGESAPAAPRVSPPAGVAVQPIETWLAAGTRESAGGGTKSRAPEAEDLAAVVYTSGTTGKPKGVMLTHRNVVANVKAVLARVAPEPADVFLSFLPLSHTFERTAGYYVPIAAGSCVAFARSVALLAEDLKLVRPTVLVSVPRIYERVYAAIQAALAASPIKRGMFSAAQAVGWRRFCRNQGLPVESAFPAWLDALAWPLLDARVARLIREQFGGRIRVAVSGGAPLSQTIAHCFLGLGLPVVQGYGMTESSPVVAANSPDDNDPATVGRLLAGVEAKLGENQELLVRGPNVMRGYWKRDADTARALVDGWLHTGDQAAIETGRIRILGRVKEIIVTSTGEKIAPVDLELAITADPLFDQAWAFGDNRPFIACIVVLSAKGWTELAHGLGLDPNQAGSLKSPAAREAVLDRINHLTRSFPRYAQPRAVEPTLEPWTIENTLMTPTLKLKRNNLAAHFATQIDSLYRR